VAGIHRVDQERDVCVERPSASVESAAPGVLDLVPSREERVLELLSDAQRAVSNRYGSAIFGKRPSYASRQRLTA
jgi:hypothetical protein